MSRRWKTRLALIAYLAGGILLSAVGPALWQVDPLIASTAASFTTLLFMGMHLFIETRRTAESALEEARRRRVELVALGRYVTDLERRLTDARETAKEATLPPSPAPAAAEAAPLVDDVAENLLRFAARVSGECRPSPVKSIATNALAQNGLELHLQPIARLRDRRTAHFEALGRIRSEDGTLIMPDRFLPELSEAGLASELDTQQLAAVIALCNRIGDKHSGARIFCNLSKSALRDDSFRAELTGFMETNARLADRLVFEMDVETVLALNTEAVADLRGLDALGFGFAVDKATLADLGRVFSVFGRVAFAKVRASELAGADPNVVAALANAGTEIIATHIESEADITTSREAGVRFGQGRHIGLPRRARTDAEPQPIAA